MRWLALEASEGPGLAVAASRDTGMQINVSRCVSCQLVPAVREHASWRARLLLQRRLRL